MPLPGFVPPMLAQLGREPFDSEEHLFEIKWDGIRTLAFVEGGAHRLFTRNRHEMTARYPELDFLRALPAGVVADGEVIVLVDGRPDFHAVLKREQARNALKIRALSRSISATYVVFDLLYAANAPLFELPLQERRARLAELVQRAGDPRLVFSDGIIGEGCAFFDKMRELDFEGMIAKTLGSPYLPGRRTDSWTKIKTVQEMPCAIMGYLVDEGGELRSLIVAAEEDGRLVCVGRVGSGLTGALRKRILALCRVRERATPIVECDLEGAWVEPGLFCTVSYLERTENGLRAPVFVELLADGPAS